MSLIPPTAIHVPNVKLVSEVIMMTMATFNEQTSFSADTAHRRILVVEDDPDWQQLIGMKIAKYDADALVKYVDSAVAAELVLNKNVHYDLIVADQSLNGTETGLDLWNSCKKTHRHIPFMMVSALEEKEFLQLIENDNDYPLFLTKKQALKQNQFEKMLNWYLGESIPIDNKIFDHRVVAAILFVAMFVYWEMVVSMLPKPFPHTPTIDVPVQKIEETIRRNNTAEFDIDKIFSPELKHEVAQVLARADEVLLEAQINIYSWRAIQ
jgi:CheY-like chemotaxis protein